MSTPTAILPELPREPSEPWLTKEVVALVDHPLHHEIPLDRQLFVNRNARMSDIEVIGFDMDYTLASYRMRKIEELSFQMTVERLCGVYGYPAELRALRYDHDFVIRGLVVDKAHGNIFKMDRFNHVGRCYHGRTPLPDAARKQLYRDVKIRAWPRAAIRLDRYPFRPSGGRALRPDHRGQGGRWREAGLRATLRRHSPGHRRGPPRWHPQDAHPR